MRTFRWLVAALLLALPAQARAPQHYDFDGLDLAVWSPAQSSGPAPVLIFSHGFGGSNEQSTKILSALADHGYWVVAPNHQDAHRLGSRPQVSFANPEGWSDQTYRDRCEDIRRTVGVLQTKAPFVGQVDLSRLGLVGHSLGGYTMLGVSGAWSSWDLPVRPRAVLVWSPFCSPYVRQRTLAGLTVPVMLQGGTRDMGITPIVARPGGAYDQAPEPKVFLELRKAGHLAWTDLNATHRDLIVDYSLRFLDAWLLGTTPTWEKAEGVEELRVSAPSRTPAR